MRNVDDQDTHSDLEYMPRLASTLTGCIRWRYEDLENALATQLTMLSARDLEQPGGLSLAQLRDIREI